MEFNYKFYNHRIDEFETFEYDVDLKKIADCLLKSYKASNLEPVKLLRKIIAELLGWKKFEILVGETEAEGFAGLDDYLAMRLEYENGNINNTLQLLIGDFDEIWQAVEEDENVRDYFKEDAEFAFERELKECE